ncbi:DUF1802 family protein [Rariglobus hedericola]|uniref:DUF1802 family protein n=1 Tax=Rariglobus hedericola TaxID=2597822 RepID=A0A556QMK7_9BACT|nr:DUF1802 family protein [Rariglobus hedericola]TSJ77863.1 DUF1802 family protein [Rariglobus hedericola]
MFPAFKEWHAIVEALGHGEQILVLRKGGISEGRGGFDAARAGRFWLFPTQFHAQADKTKPHAARFFGPATSSDTVVLSYFADIVHHTFLTDWPDVAALDSHHLWNEAAVREKFDWSQPPGVHAFVVRVHRLATPLILSLTADMGGCKSWIEVPADFSAQGSAPVLDDESFQARKALIGLR